MPIRPCSKDGKQGYKWGDGGNCIIRSTPEEAKKVVIRQGLKIEGPQKFAKIMRKDKGKSFTKEDVAFANQLIDEIPSGWYAKFGANIKKYFEKADEVETLTDKIDHEKDLDSEKPSSDNFGGENV